MADPTDDVHYLWSYIDGSSILKREKTHLDYLASEERFKNPIRDIGYSHVSHCTRRNRQRDVGLPQEAI